MWRHSEMVVGRSKRWPQREQVKHFLTSFSSTFNIIFFSVTTNRSRKMFLFSLLLICFFLHITQHGACKKKKIPEKKFSRWILFTPFSFCSLSLSRRSDLRVCTIIELKVKKKKFDGP